MLNINQVITNINTVIESGINKVFIINHSVSDDELLTCVSYVKIRYPKLWIGINRLGKSKEQALASNLDVDALWCDQTLSIEDYNNKEFKGMVFGGLSFKYQPAPTDLKLASEEACLSTDVATTSGVGTGKAADMYKILKIRE
jgi:hypothetical protein